MNGPDEEIKQVVVDAEPVARARAPVKSSLAFILGNDESDGEHSSSIAGEEYSDSSDQAPDGQSTRSAAVVAPKPEGGRALPGLVKKSRICKHDNCTRYVVNRGLCIGHGGGKRCAVDGCTSSAKNLGVCWKHGGSTKCTIEGCDNRAKSRGVCWSHGGGRKCRDESCSKTAVSNGLCWAHGGGKRCVVEGCKKPAYERNGNRCNLHQPVKKSKAR
ncbi:TPA: hypothetical protein N0F65_011351 [Lagenidium giganteum]|uniref:WRKY19-like zinc finger domain-containing protein n=1 Tax=Lagenidium giganteum TaxID=4803 RepID=A0AAV2ZAF3_9STRA|nr:TPA: hypothetical protein N0F65_011351 [Lagenidium giganteum]